MENLIGLDIGNRRIGVAVAETNVAVPLLTLPNNRRFLTELQRLVKIRNVGKIVVGLPLTFSGNEGEQVVETKRLVEKIQHDLNIPIVWQDERLTTKAAADIQRRHGPEFDIDAWSAQVILQSFIDSSAGPSQPAQ
jgi:putative holliday junction resolvase